MNLVADMAVLLNVVEWLTLASLKTIPLIVLLLILQRFFRHSFSASAHHLLWITVLISLTIPVGWNMNIQSLTELGVETNSSQQESPIDNGLVLASTTEVNHSEPAISERPVATEKYASWINRLANNAGVVAAMVWLIGVVVLLLVTLIKARHYYRIKRDALVVAPDVAQMFEGCKENIHYPKSVQLLCSKHIHTPIAMGLFQPTIIIPLDLENTLSAEQLNYVLLHELGHIKRRDLWFNWIVSLINIIHWFNPLVWFASRRMRTDMEAACDALVLSHLPKKQHKNYGETLIELSDFLPYSSRALSAVGILENHHELKERLKMIKQVTTMNFKSGILFSVILVTSAITAFAQPSQKTSVEQGYVIAQKMTLQAFALMTEKVLKSEVLVNAKDADTPVRIRTNINELDYPGLLTQLKQNGFTAYKSNGAINFIQIGEARNSPVPVVEKNKTYFDDEYVTESIKPEKACSSKLLPALRPLVPQEGHMTTSENPDMIILVDTYSNIQRIKAIIKQIDDGMDKPADCVY